MKLSSIIKNFPVIRVQGEDIEINNIVYNSNSVTPGDMFFCIEGYKTDGHKYAADAVKRGAKALVIRKDIEEFEGVTKIYVKDTREAMAKMASEYYERPSEKLDIIGITGTNGKTTSTFMLKSILERAGRKTGLLGTIYNITGKGVQEAKRTTPESLDLFSIFAEMHESNMDSCVMEVSSHSLELKRVYGVRFKAAIFTNLTQDHLDFHITMENYFNAKLKIFENCETAVINIDDEYGKRAADTVKGRAITYGLSDKAQFRAENIVITENGTDFTLCTESKKADIKLGLPGKFNVYNALGCAAAAYSAGISIDKIAEGLNTMENVPGRSEKIVSERGFSVIIDYAHTPDSIKNILITAREYTKGRLVIVFGCGGDRDKTKRPIMGETAGNNADFCIVTSDNPRSEEPGMIIQDILPGVKKTGREYVVIEDRRKAIDFAIKNAKKDDVVIIAGKGHETYQILKDKTIHFDEREIVNEILEEEF